MSATLINSDLLDILGATEIIGSAKWNLPDHPFNALSAASLKKMKKEIDKGQTETDTERPVPSILQTASSAIQRFAANLPKILVRRHENSRWFGNRLLELPTLSQHVINVHFPNGFLPFYETMVDDWKAKNLDSLQEAQQAWDKNRHSNAYLRQHPERPGSLDSKDVFSKARMLRVCSNIPYLIKLLSPSNPSSTGSKFKWTNVGVRSECEGTKGLLKRGCFLDLYYDSIFSNSPKVKAIGQILKRHKHSPAVIMTSFPEFILIIKRVSRQTSLALMRIEHYLTKPDPCSLS